MKKILTSIWFLALVIAIPIVIFLPPIFDKYKVELKSIESKANGLGITYFADLQSDGEIYRIEAFNAEHKLLAFHCFDSKHCLYDQFNFPHTFNNRLGGLYFFDTDEDNLTEVYGFTVHEDSVFLSYVEPFDKNHEFQTFFVTRIATDIKKELDVSVKEIKYFDFDGDGNEELVFSIAVGYNWFPRKLYVFHPETGKIELSEEFGVHFNSFTPFDYNMDGTNELMCISSSAYNIDDGTAVKYLDNRPRLFLFNGELRELYKPIEFPKGIGSRLEYFILDEKTGETIILYNNFSVENSITFVTKIYPDGKSESEDTLFLTGRLGNSVKLYQEDENNFIVFSSRGKVFRIDNNLNLIDSKDLEYKSEYMVLGKYNIVEGGEPEYCAISDNNTLHIYLEDFRREVKVEYDSNVYTSSFIDSPIKNEFIINAKGHLNYYKIWVNPFYYIEYPSFLVIYLLTVGFIWLLQLARIKQLKEKFELQQQVKELQFLSLKNQLDPHFIFNTFNTIASSIKQGKSDEAYNLMIRFSKLVRINLEDSGGIYTTLKKELKFVEDYLTIQKIRFKDLFDYTIEIEKSVRSEISIPKLLVQIHVENALKHGVRPLRTGGVILVKVSNEFAYLKIEITDNGIGRKKSKLLKLESTGIGLKAIKQIIELNNQSKKHKITQQISDSKDEQGNLSGTKVVLLITT